MNKILESLIFDLSSPDEEAQELCLRMEACVERDAYQAALYQIFTIDTEVLNMFPDKEIIDIIYLKLETLAQESLMQAKRWKKKALQTLEAK